MDEVVKSQMEEANEAVRTVLANLERAGDAMRYAQHRQQDERGTQSFMEWYVRHPSVGLDVAWLAWSDEQ